MKLYDCGCLLRGAPSKPWPHYCPKCEQHYDSELWSTVRSLAVLVVVVLGLMMTCAGGG